jgi:hypothetical protein
VEAIVTRCRSLGALALLAALWFSSIGTTQSQDPQALAQAFAAAWNAHDADAFAQLVAGQVASRPRSPQ